MKPPGIRFLPLLILAAALAPAQESPRTLRGTVRRTLLRGRTIFRDGGIVGDPSGRFVRPQTQEKT